MPGSTSNPRIWLGADAYVAVFGSTAPTDVATAWAAAWVALGLLSDDGMRVSRDVDSTDHYAWGGVLVRTTRSKFKSQIRVTCLEDNKTVWYLVNAGSTAVTAATITTRTTKVPTVDIRAFGFQLTDGATILRRIIPRGEVVDVAEITLQDSGMTAYELTINVYPDSNNVLYIDITNDAQAIVP